MLASLLGSLGVGAPSIALADDDMSLDAPALETPWIERHAFDRDFAFAVYGLGWAGSYLGGGGGLRARWEPFDRLGVEVYSEHLALEDNEGVRHDHPIGFNLYVPFRVAENFRVRPLFGFCTVFSFLHPDNQSDRVDDVHFGVHAGAGVEYALGRFASLFLDVQATGYAGHDRYAGGWSTHVGDQLSMWLVVSGAVGVQLHL